MERIYKQAHSLMLATGNITFCSLLPYIVPDTSKYSVRILNE